MAHFVIKILEVKMNRINIEMLIEASSVSVGTQCVSLCAPGTYGKTSTETCEPCPPECSTCVENNLVVICTSCPADRVLHRQKCVKDCEKSAALFPYLRLTGNSSNPFEGLVEVRFKGEWHTVCDNKFELPDARVICRELGYGEPISFGNQRYRLGTGKILVDDLECTGNEESFLDCPQKRWFSSDCSHAEDVDITCSGPPAGSTVLGKCVTECGAGLFLTTHNTCELCSRECAACVTSPEECTACRDPYFLNASSCSTSCPDGMYASATTRSCQHCDSSRGCRTCEDQPDRCLSCIPPKIQKGTKCVSSCGSGMYRDGHVCVADCGLMRYGNSSSGECHACPLNCYSCELGETGLVECRMCVLGFVLDAQKNCVKTCPSGYFAAPVNVSTFGVRPILRLSIVGRSKFSGRLEILHDGVWGSICDDYWSNTNAKVACAQMLLGPPRKSYYNRRQSFREMNISKIWLDDVHCYGDEENLSDCKHRGWSSHNCGHHEDVHLECSSPGVSSCLKQCPIGYFANERVCKLCDEKCLVCFGSRSNCSICAEGFHLTLNGTCVVSCPAGQYVAADSRCLVCNSSCATCEGSDENCTSCRSPYLLEGNRCVSCIPPMLRKGRECVSSCPPDMYRKDHTCVDHCGVMYYPRPLSSECQACPLNCHTCEGRNAGLVECKVCALGYTMDAQKNCVKNCSSGYFHAPVNLTAVGIRPTLRLSSVGLSWFSGRLEVLHDGVWGTVCDDYWTLANAKVACAQMLLGPPKVTKYLRYKSFQEIRISKIWLDDVVCKGDEERLSDCSYLSWGRHNCGHHEDVHLQCSSPGVSSCQKQCPIGYFAKGRVCEPCDGKCLVCFGSRSNCSKCVEGFHLSVNNACIDSCPLGQYATADKRCDHCNASCWSCEGSRENCTSCHPPYFLFRNRCVLSCPPDTHKLVSGGKLKLISRKGPYEGEVEVSSFIKGIISSCTCSECIHM